MNEMAKISAGQPESHKTQSVEKIITEFGGVFTDDNGIAQAVAINGEGVVPVPNEIAQMISLSLRAQEKVWSGKYPHLSKLLLLLNCRKSVFVTGGQMDMSTALEKDSEDVNGIEALLGDVERLQERGYHGYLVEASYLEAITEHLDEYDGTFPAVIHIFEIKKDTDVLEIAKKYLELDVPLPPELVAKLPRVHSFIILGEDEEGYVLFQKEGPQLEQPFMVASLNRFSYELTDDRVGLVFAGPM